MVAGIPLDPLGLAVVVLDWLLCNDSLLLHARTVASLQGAYCTFLNGLVNMLNCLVPDYEPEWRSVCTYMVFMRPNHAERILVVEGLVPRTCLPEHTVVHRVAPFAKLSSHVDLNEEVSV